MLVDVESPYNIKCTREAPLLGRTGAYMCYGLSVYP